MQAGIGSTSTVAQSGNGLIETRLKLTDCAVRLGPANWFRKNEAE